LKGGLPISHLPKLKIKLPSDYPAEDVCELEQAKYLLNFDRGIILVEGQRVYSYDELVQLASQDKYKNKEFIEVVGILPISGG
jgi:hypothetical protein